MPRQVNRVVRRTRNQSRKKSERPSNSRGPGGINTEHGCGMASIAQTTEVAESGIDTVNVRLLLPIANRALMA
jgi:hypothetical protein